jgi:GR25 family glycosyltransferase involved in LPS biosynthesis
MIVKNEGHIIADTLAHLLKYIQFDYWVISDTGSTDKTKEIIQDFFKARNIPGELVETPWRDFGFNRSEAFRHAYKKTDYAFVWDADDEISGDFKLPAVLDADSYLFTFGCEDGFRYSRAQMFNNHQKWIYKGVLHEYAMCTEPTKPSDTITGNYYFISGRRGDRSKDPNKYLKDAIILEKASAEALASKDSIYNRYIFYCAQSYASCNMHEKAIEFYKKAADSKEQWQQERYISCLEIYEACEKLKKPEEALRYLVDSYSYDPKRVECIYRLIKYYCINNATDVAYMYYTLIQKYFENEYPTDNISSRLFARKSEYDFYLPYYMVITAEKTGNLATAAKMYEMIVKQNYLYVNDWWVRNLIFNMQFCISHLPNRLDFFLDFMKYISALEVRGITFEPVQRQVIERVIEKYKPLLIQTYTGPLPIKQSSTRTNVLFTMTTCKRFDLFEKTMNSILNTWTDLDKVDYFFCVDDNSRQIDRTKMTKGYPFMNFYMKDSVEKGHRASMNIIYDKIKELQPTYWIHMEDDWLFFQQEAYVQKSINFLDRNQGKNIHQILYNRNYAETYEGWSINGGQPIEPGFLLHLKSDQIQGQNCGYWPHYSFRPSMTRAQVILDLGNYDSPNTFFERDYADRYFAKGYQSAFFNTITSLHIGKLTSDRTGENAYTLNKTGQFNTTITKTPNTFIINLKRRTDRKEEMEKTFDTAGFTDYEFIEAVDGSTLEATEEISKLFAGNDFGSRKGVIGCALSHYNLWKKLATDDQHSFYTIFEDDITVSNTFCQRLETALKDELTDVDILFLGYTLRDENKHHIHKRHDKAISTNMRMYIGGFFGYVITKQGCAKLLEYIETNGIKHGIDYLVKIIPGLRCYNLQPHIVFTEWVQNNSSPVDTDIQKDYSSIILKTNVKEDEWDMYEGMDSGGGDIQSTQITDVKELLKIASATPNCVAFNTLGFLKSRVKFPLIKSPWLSAPDGIYIKKGYVPKIRVKMLCNWCSSIELCREWLKMSQGNYSWNNIQITWEDDDIDYYVIINKPQADAKFIPEKTIIFHMEPWCSGPEQNWGVKTWGEWANPDPAKFLQVRSHDTFLNTGFWQLNMNYSQLSQNLLGKKEPSLGNIISSVCSSKYFDPGHKKRIDFMKFIESKLSPDVQLHIFNEDNQHGFTSYKGKARAFIDKQRGILPYKYYFMCENNAEYNFITEKLWEPILCESLCFYWGCPNVSDYINPLAYVQLDMNDFEGSYQIMKEAVQKNLWLERLPYIQEAKRLILNKYAFFPVLEEVLTPKKICFIHSCHLASAGTERLNTVLESAKAIKELDSIIINNIGIPLDEPFYTAQDKRIQVLQHSEDPNLFEIPTLKLMSEFSKKHPSAKVLYLHSKSISYHKQSELYACCTDWIKMMLHFMCKRSADCLKALDTYDTTGCNYREDNKWPPHYSGNFWWANANYIKQLSTSSLTNKMSAEWWLLTGRGSYKEQHNANIDHFIDRYPEIKYNTEYVGLFNTDNKTGLCNQMMSLISGIWVAIENKKRYVVVGRFSNQINGNSFIPACEVFDFDLMNTFLKKYDIILVDGGSNVYNYQWRFDWIYRHNKDKFEEFTQYIRFQKRFYDLANSFIKTIGTSYNCVHLRVEDDVVDHIVNYYNKNKEDVINQLHTIYVESITKNMSTDLPLVVLCGDKDNSVIQYLHNNNYKVLQCEKLLEGRELNAIVDLIIGASTTELFISNYDAENMAGSSFSYTILQWLNNCKTIFCGLKT